MPHAAWPSSVFDWRQYVCVTQYTHENPVTYCSDIAPHNSTLLSIGLTG